MFIPMHKHSAAAITTATATAINTTLIENVQRLAHELGLGAALPRIPDVLSQANAMFCITPPPNASAISQADVLMTIVYGAC